MSRFEGPRGLAGYTRFDTAQGVGIQLQESSAVMALTPHGEVHGPFVWLRIVDRPGQNSGSFAHLSVRDATELRDGLTAFLTETNQEVER